MPVDIQTFCDAWNSSKTVQECADKVGIAYSSASDRACRLRKKGYDVKRLGVPERPIIYTTDELMKALHRKWRNGSKPPIERFLQNVSKSGPDECWMWTGHPGTMDRAGFRYGIFGITVNGRAINFKAHRLAWAIDRKKSPKGLVIRHGCDVPLCCNPKHLTSGTQADNVQDKLEADRQYSGQRHHSIKLTDEDVYEIRDSSESIAALKARFGVHGTHIRRIQKRETRCSLPERVTPLQQQ